MQVAQYPLDMGRPSAAGKSSQVLAVTTDATGRVNYDAVIRQGHDKGTIIVSEHSALVPKVDVLKHGVSLLNLFWHNALASVLLDASRRVHQALICSLKDFQ